MTVTQDRVSSAELQRRTIRRSDYVSCNQAFIDYRTPGSDTKENYSIIGPGVTQNAAQVINLSEAHGFNIGAAAMPNGVTNNLHLHFTAEVFINFGGDFLVRWGIDGADGEYLSHDGDVISVPTWIFRGFTNVGPDDGWLFTVLGFDATGGIIWGPSVLNQAREHGLVLTTQNQVVDLTAGESVPAGADLITPMPDAEISRLRRWTPEQMRTRVTTDDDRVWSAQPFLCSGLPGGRAQLCLVVGYGMTEDREQEPRIHNPHNFNLAWLRAEHGEGMLTHRHDQSQAVIVRSGRWRVVVNRGGDEIASEVGPFDTVSIPAGAWRAFEVVSSEPGELVVVNGGDGRVRLDWDADVARMAEQNGSAQDAAGYLAPWALIHTSVEDD